MASRTYTYDSQNQLTDAKRFNSSGTQDGDWSYGFDANGNLTSQKVLSSGVTTTTNYSYNADNELTQAVISGGATTTYSYDADGNETGSTNGPATTYNTQNQATTVGSNTYSYSGTGQQFCV